MSKETKLYVNGSMVIIKGDIESIEVEKASKFKKDKVDKIMKGIKEFAHNTESIRAVVEPIIIKSAERVVRNFVGAKF